MKRFLLFLLLTGGAFAQTIPADVGVFNLAGGSGGGGGSGTVTSVSFTGGLISVANPTVAASLTVAGTSGGVPYFSSTSTWASSSLLVANSIMIGGGAGAPPATTTTGTGILTALGVNVGSAGAPVINGGVLGTPSSGTVTNLTGTASININGTVGATTPAAGTFTTLTSTGIAAIDGATASATTALIVPAGTTGVSSFRVPHGAAPTAPVNGDFWTTAAGLFGRINGSTVSYGAAGAGTVSVVGAGSLTSTALVTGGGTTTLQTPSATATMDSSGNISTPGTLTVGNAATTAGAVVLTQGTTQSTGTTNITLQAPTAVTSHIYTLPGTVGTNGAFWTQTTSGTTATLLNTKVVPTGTVLGTTDTQTLTNKWVQARITTITSSATPAVNTDACDCVNITALAAAITSMTSSLTGTPVDFDQLEYRIKDNATPRAITWGASFVAGPTALPTTTVTSKCLHVYFEWDAVQSKWVCISSGSDA